LVSAVCILCILMKPAGLSKLLLKTALKELLMAELSVGIIGVNLTGGWATEAHIPAIQSLQGMQLISVATSRHETAGLAAHAFGLKRGYGNGAELIQDPEIDIVTVATRVPDHRELLLAAIAAGKHVYSEWPLAVNTHDARDIAAAARKAGIRHAIGLQLRGSPAVQHAQHLLADGAIGRLLSIRTYSTTAGFGPDVPAQFAYLEEPAHFANLVTIQGAHTLDLVLALGGPLASMAALPSRQYPEVQMGDPRQPAARRTFDHLLMQGFLVSGVSFNLEVGGGYKNSTPFYLEMIGEKGTLRLEGGLPGEYSLHVSGYFTMENFSVRVKIACASLKKVGSTSRESVAHCVMTF
jgi:predicted dehydrogenase